LSARPKWPLEIKHRMGAATILPCAATTPFLIFPPSSYTMQCSTRLSSSQIAIVARRTSSLVALKQRYHVKEVRYDPYQMAATAQRLSHQGIKMVEFPQSVGNLTAASQNLYELIKGQNLVVYPDAPGELRRRPVWRQPLPYRDPNRRCRRRCLGGRRCDRRRGRLVPALL
jgi:hypothetical protein